VLTIDAARERAREAIRRIKAGLPAIEPPPVKPDSFRAVAEEWLRRHVAAKGLRSRPEIERVLLKNIYPFWAKRDFTGLRRSDIAALLDKVEDKSGASGADHVLAIIRGISAWYATRHDEYASPFVRGMRRTDPKSRTRARILGDDELRRVWRTAETAGTYGALIRILLLSAQRRGAVVRMKWIDISPDGVWEIASEEREKGNAGALRLPKQALVIINAQPRLNNNRYVFAAARGNGALNGFHKRKSAFDKACGVRDWVLHDLRRTARSLMARAGVSREHAERVLGHVLPGVEGVYDRHHYDDEKAAALDRLANLIKHIVDGPTENVVMLHPSAVS
jgi:integrase